MVELQLRLRSWFWLKPYQRAWKNGFVREALGISGSRLERREPKNVAPPAPSTCLTHGYQIAPSVRKNNGKNDIAPPLTRTSGVGGGRRGAGGRRRKERGEPEEVAGIAGWAEEEAGALRDWRPTALGVEEVAGALRGWRPTTLAWWSRTSARKLGVWRSAVEAEEKRCGGGGGGGGKRPLVGADEGEGHHEAGGCGRGELWRAALELSAREQEDLEDPSG